MDSSICPKYIQEQFVLLYNKMIRLTFGFSNNCNLNLLLN